MNKKVVKKNNSISINRIVLIIITCAILLQGAIWLIDTVYLFRADIKNVEEIQMDNIKSVLEQRVAAVIGYSDYRGQEIDALLREELSNRTYEAYALMNSIYFNNKDTKTKVEITEMIKDALRDIRFNEGRGYFFVDTLEADVILYPIFPESEGENLINLQDDNGNYTVQEEIQLVKTEGEGFIEGFWKKPLANSDETYKKIAFVKEFEPYGWYLGCGDYLEDMTNDVKQEVIEYVNSIQYGENNAQYVFIHDYTGVELANGVYPELIGVNNYELEDINGSKVIREQIKICVEVGSGYLTHYWPTVDGDSSYRKLTYIAALPEWNWVIGTGIDISYVDDLIVKKENQLKNVILGRVLIIVLILAILIVASMLYVRVFMRKIKKNFTVFRDYMLSARMKLTTIDVNSLDYADFSELAEVTNSMTDRINQLLHFDELTNVYNRRLIMEIFDSVLEEFPDATGIILLDIDFFKKINDNFGHEIGDETLVAIAKTIEDSIPKSGSVGRFGGEEFLVILPEVTVEKTIEVAEDIRKSIENLYMSSIEGHSTISGGVVHSSCCEKEKLFKQADDKMYLAKSLGRNRIEF